MIIIIMIMKWILATRETKTRGGKRLFHEEINNYENTFFSSFKQMPSPFSYFGKAPRSRSRD